MLTGSFFIFLIFVMPALVPLVLELILIERNPMWFRWLALGTIDEHAFSIDKPKHEIDSASGYREALPQGGLPALPRVQEFADSRIVSHGTVAMLQRRFATGRGRGGRTPKWLLVRIDATRVGDTITLRARRVMAPVSLVLGAIIFCAMCATSVSNLLGSIAMVALMTITFAFIGLLNRDPRNSPCKKAFARLEREYRRALEMPSV